MTRNTQNTKTTNEAHLDEISEMPSAHIQTLWRKLQRKYYSQEQFFIHFSPESDTDAYWRSYLKILVYQSPIRKKNKYLEKWFPTQDFIGNKDLAHIFQKEYKATPAIWKSLKKSIVSKGFFVPRTALKRLEINVLEKHLIHLSLLNRHFPLVLFLESLKKAQREFKASQLPLPIIGLLQYFIYYAQFLKTIATNYKGQFKSIKTVLIGSIDSSNFQQQLPSTQLWILLHLKLQMHHYGNLNSAELQDFVHQAHSEIRIFWEKYIHTFQFIIENGYPPIAKRSIGTKLTIYSIRNLNLAFSELFKHEFELVKIQVLVDEHLKGDHYTNTFPMETRLKFSTRTATKANLEKAIGKQTIFDRIKNKAVKEKVALRPLFYKISDNWMKEEELKWHDFDLDEQNELLTAVQKHLTIQQSTALELEAQKRWVIYTQSFGNQLFAPFFYWKKIKNDLVPQWNVLANKKSVELAKEFDDRHEKETVERLKLKAVLKSLAAQNTVSTTEKISATVEPFHFAHLQEQWDKAVRTQLASLKQKSAYRIRRMKEFGILKAGDIPNKKLEIWLDEMLLVEKEISPYIPFVKKAFLMALPNKTSVEFNPYQHSHDGIEFDPETTQDQHKWLRGEVMKTLHAKVGKADAEQVNTFALDFSGSMRHHKMRNLFKMLYLMVMGLEGRKSYDAFHFFGTEFIETVNFSHQHTNRSLLFKILRQIARIDAKGVYYGGIGGTNMSEGIIQSHERIKTFSKKLKQQYPERFFLKSIFVITDGEPSLGIHIPEKLHEEIERRRKNSNIAIKGIYLKPEKEKYASFMERIFGKNHFIETSDFAEAIQRLIYIMTQTYKQQRNELRQQKIKEKYERNRNLYK